jgi:hypothetical protein
MTAIVKALSSVLPAIPSDSDMLKMLAVFCGLGLVASLILITSGISAVPADPQVLNVMSWI